MLAVIPLLGAALGPQGSPPVDGLMLWLDAADERTVTREGGLVSAWISKAPGEPVTLTAAGTQRPQYVTVQGRGPRSALRFDGRNDVLRCTGFGRRMRTWTLVAVVAPLRPAKGAITSACPAGGEDYDPGFTVDLYDSVAQFDYLSVEGAGRQGGRLNQRTGSTPLGAFAVVVVCRDEHEVRLCVDGRPEASRPVTPADTVADEVRIGARYFGGREREFLNGELAEVLLYERALSDDERRALEQTRIVSAAECTAGQEYAVSMDPRGADPRMAAPTVLRTWPTVEAYLQARERGEVEGGPPVPLAGLPIRTDLLEAIRLGRHCLNSSFDRDRDDEPFFYSNCRADGTGEFHHSVQIGIPHVVGRCLLGNTAASLATRMPFPPDGLAILTRYLKSSFDNADHLNSFFDPEKSGERGIEFHNMREGLYGLWALMHTDEVDWARAEAERMLETLDRLTDDSGRWSPELAADLGMGDRCWGLSVPNAARMVDPLLAVHRLTGGPIALRLAEAYARAGLAEVFTAEGRFAPMDRSSGHVHSITSSLSGMTEFALLTGDAEMPAACRRIMDVGVPEYFSSWGWGDEVFPEHPADEVSRGEINQTGDVIRTALLLGEAGEARYYELAERLLRSMLLPTQHREEELRRFLRDNEHPTRDAERDVIARSVGGYSMQLPNDRMAEGDWPIQTQDITSGAVHALAECRRHRTTFREGTVSVNLLLDYEGEAVSLRSALPLVGRIAFTAHQDLRLRVRVPDWVDAATLRATVDGGEHVVALEAGYADLGPLQAGSQGELTFAVPCKVERETVDGVTYTTMWVGNQLVDIRPRGTVSPLPF